MEKVEKYLKNTIKEKETVIACISGGPDSMCLLSLLLELKIKIIVAHVNHNIRDEALEEEKFVKNFSKVNNIIFESITLNSYKDNFHNDARNQRYKFFNELKEKYKAKYIITAHHGDDLIETILMRITRGSNLSGYKGFKIKLDHYLKPLTLVTKEDILNYVKDNNIEYKMDLSNESDKYTRNRYRKILPLLKAENKDVHLKYLKFSEKLDEYDTFIKDYIHSKNILKDNKIFIDKYLLENKFIQKRVIEMLINDIQKESDFSVTDNIILEIDKFLNGKCGKGEINLPNNFLGIKEKKEFFIKKSQKYGIILNANERKD